MPELVMAVVIGGLLVFGVVNVVRDVAAHRRWVAEMERQKEGDGRV